MKGLRTKRKDVQSMFYNAIKSFGYVLAAFILIPLTSVNCEAGDCAIRGHVYTNNMPLKESEVVLISASGEKKAITGKDGSFEFKGLEPGEYYLKAGKMPTYPFMWWENAQEKFKAKKLNLNNKVIEDIKFELRPKFLFTSVCRGYIFKRSYGSPKENKTF